MKLKLTTRKTNHHGDRRPHLVPSEVLTLPSSSTVQINNFIQDTNNAVLVAVYCIVAIFCGRIVTLYCNVAE